MSPMLPFIATPIFVSYESQVRFEQRSFMYTKKRTGPRTEPCGSDDVTLHLVEYSPFKTTCCSRFDRQYPIHPNRWLPITALPSFFSKGGWGTCRMPLQSQIKWRPLVLFPPAMRWPYSRTWSHLDPKLNSVWTYRTGKTSRRVLRSKPEMAVFTSKLQFLKKIRQTIWRIKKTAI
jgi:hypothetical protein